MNRSYFCLNTMPSINCNMKQCSEIRHTFTRKQCHLWTIIWNIKHIILCRARCLPLHWRLAHQGNLLYYTISIYWEMYQLSRATKTVTIRKNIVKNKPVVVTKQVSGPPLLLFFPHHGYLLLQTWNNSMCIHIYITHFFDSWGYPPTFRSRYNNFCLLLQDARQDHFFIY